MGLKITSGEWVKRADKEWPEKISIEAEGHYVALVDFCGAQNGNTDLICDAGNVANKTGLTPSELLAQRDELLEALKSARILIKDARIWEALQYIGTAIAKAKGTAK